MVIVSNTVAENAIAQTRSSGNGAKVLRMTLARLELAIFGSEDQRLIHEATGPLTYLGNVSSHARFPLLRPNIRNMIVDYAVGLLLLKSE